MQMLFRIWYWVGTLRDNSFIQEYHRQQNESLKVAKIALEEAFTPKLMELLNEKK